MTWHTTLDESDLYEIVESYTEGKGIVELAREFRTRTSVIGAVLAENGVPRRKDRTTSTPIECRLHDALKAAGIGFTTQRRLVGRYVVDISIHQAPIVIEADGALHRSTLGAGRDKVRDEAHEAAGYRVFRFTGTEINSDAGACIAQVIDACGLTADENPVYDIRTKFTGPDHPRYVGLYELTCQYCGETFQNKRSKRKYCSHEHYVLGAQKGKPKSEHVRAMLIESNRRRGRNWYYNQIMRESDLRGDSQRPAETTGPATLF